VEVQATVVLKGGTLTSSFDANAGEESTVACDTEISAARVEGVGTLLSPEGAELALRRIGMFDSVSRELDRSCRPGAGLAHR